MSEGHINMANEISLCVCLCITNGVINTLLATFFVWLYWNKLLFTDELCAY